MISFIHCGSEKMSLQIQVSWQPVTLADAREGGEELYMGP